MFNIWQPISYNTNLNSILSHYYMGFCGGNCSPYASLFNPPWVYNNGIGVGNPYFQDAYQCGNYYPNIFALNYSNPYMYYGGGGGGSVSSSSSTTTSSSAPKKITSPSTTVAKPETTKVTNPVKKTVTNNAINRKEVSLGQEFVNVARKYENCSELNGTHHKFCVNPTCKTEDPFDQEWCTDYVTYVVKEAYRNKGKTPPAGFGNHDVETLKNWAISNNYFIRTSDKPAKGSYIAKNIKAGDIMIINENGASHTGFVTKIDKNTGVIHTIEGNRDDMVKEFKYSPNYSDLSGFIRLTS